MAIRPNNGTLFKGFIFDGIDSKDFGVYLTQEAAYSAPEREVEMIEIAGRNGAYALDKGRFLNIEVTYKAAITATDEASFAEGISALRNALCSRVGYKRLEDDYNPDEYRLAIYKSGLEVATADILKAGEFDLVFDCKPQRYLISGEAEQSITSGSTITNPTLFDAHPLLSFEGVGNINLGGQTIQVNDVLLGWITVNSGWNFNPVTNVTSVEKTFTINTANLNTGDTIRVGDGSSANNGIFTCGLLFDGIGDVAQEITGSISYGTRDFTFTFDKLQNPREEIELVVRFSKANFIYGTSASKSAQGTATYKVGGATAFSVTVQTIIEYNGSNQIRITTQLVNAGTRRANLMYLVAARTRANSTKSTLSGVTYIDLDIAEAWMVKSGQTIVSANDHVIIGADVPVLPSGNTIITYSNTITNFKIIPRWWRV